MDIAIRTVTLHDAEAIVPIYNAYVADSCVTFETRPVPVAAMRQQIHDTISLSLPWLVAETSTGIIGYACASKWKGRCAYGQSVEPSIYLRPRQTGRGIGLRLYSALIDRLRAQSVHTMVAGIALPNVASVKLHERLGFHKVAHFSEIGYKLERWVDVGYWQRLLQAAAPTPPK